MKGSSSDVNRAVAHRERQDHRTAGDREGLPRARAHEPGAPVRRGGAHGAARDEADHGGDHRLPGRDRRQARRRAPRPEGRRPGGHDRRRLRHRRGDDPARARRPGQRGDVVEGAGVVGDDRAHPGVRAAAAGRARGEAGAPTTGIAALAEAAKAAESTAQDWLAVLARCFQLQDAIAVLEIDRVLDVAPDDFDGHRMGLRAVRQKRLDTISQTTLRLLERMDAAAGLANAKVLLNPFESPAIVRSRGHVAGAVTRFHRPLGIVSGGPVGGGAGLDVRRHGVPGQGAGDRSGGRRRVLAPRERDLRPGQVGDGQALQRDRRARGAVAGERRGARAGRPSKRRRPSG